MLCVLSKKKSILEPYGQKKIVNESTKDAQKRKTCNLRLISAAINVVPMCNHTASYEPNISEIITAKEKSKTDIPQTKLALIDTKVQAWRPKLL